MTPSNSSASSSSPGFAPGDIVTLRFVDDDRMVVIGKDHEYVVIAREDGDSFDGDDEFYRGYTPLALVKVASKPTVEDLAYTATQEVDDYVKSFPLGYRGLWCDTCDVITTACIAAITEALADA